MSVKKKVIKQRKKMPKNKKVTFYRPMHYTRNFIWVRMKNTTCNNSQLFRGKFAALNVHNSSKHWKIISFSTQKFREKK